MDTRKVMLVDDHQVLRQGLAALVDSLGGFKTVLQASNGKDMIGRLRGANGEQMPDIVLLDINMPEMDGYESAAWLRSNYPEIMIVALSMYDTDNSIIRMLRNGARGYLLKDMSADELRSALQSINEKGYFYSDLVTNKLVSSLTTESPMNENALKVVRLTDREIETLKFLCTELSYKEIAEQMFLSPRTVDGIRDSLFEKLNVKTRVGLVLYAIRNGVVNV